MKDDLLRWVKGENPHVRYVFTVLEEKELDVDGNGEQA